MKSKQFKKIVGSQVEVLRNTKSEDVGTSKSLVSLLIKWYDKKLKELQKKDRKGGDNNDR